MSREAHIPLALWISAAIVAHLAGGGGAVEVAQTMKDRADLVSMVHALRGELRPADTTFEILTDTTPLTPSEQPAEAPDKDAPLAPAEEDPEAPKPEPARAETKEPEPSKEPEPTKPVPDPLKPEVAKAPPPPPMLPSPAAPAPPPPPPPDGRIAVKQHVQDKQQEDNPEAKRIADDANRVDEETMARLRSHDHDDATPETGAPVAAGPRNEVGNNDHTKIADSEDHAGSGENAPGEASASSTSATHDAPGPKNAPTPRELVKSPPSSPGGATPGGARGRVAAAPAAAPPPPPGGAGPASPEVAVGDNGSYSLNPANPGGDGKSRQPGRRQAPAPYRNPVKVGNVGLGAPGEPGGPKLNLDMSQVVASVGDKQLAAERAADGAARRSAHRGQGPKNNFDKYRAAIENYDPSVKEGNQTALNAARVPFASYINMIHNRLHPIFAEEFLGALENLPPSHALNGELVTHVEIVLNKDDGRIVRLGVTRASGVTAFDIVALNSVQRASPYGKAPDAIVSPDGNVYLHWEFHRDPFDACTTRNARPFLLKEAPKSGVRPTFPRPRPPTKSGDETPSPGPLLPLR